MPWHARIHPRCTALQGGNPPCGAIRTLFDGIKLCKAHPVLVAQIVAGIDAEWLVRQQAELDAEFVASLRHDD